MVLSSTLFVFFLVSTFPSMNEADVVQKMPGNEQVISTPAFNITEDPQPLWGTDKILRNGSVDVVSIERAPGSNTTFFAVAFRNFSSINDIFLLKTTDGGYTWHEIATISYYGSAGDHIDLAVTNEYVFVVYSTGDIICKKYTYSGNLVMTKTVFSSVYTETDPSICTDAESYPTGEYLYLAFYRNDAGLGTEIYFVYLSENLEIISDTFGIFGAGSDHTFRYPDIIYDNSSSHRVHIVAWDQTENSIVYRVGSSYGNSWSSIKEWSPSSSDYYRLARVDAHGNRVLITWEKNNYYTVYAYSTNGGASFVGPYRFTSEYIRPAPIIANTSNYMYIISWNSGKVCVLKSYGDPSQWYSSYVSSNSYSYMPWFSFDGITCGDGHAKITWTDNYSEWCFDAEDWIAGVESNKNENDLLIVNYIRPGAIEISLSITVDEDVECALIDDCGRRVLSFTIPSGQSHYVLDSRGISSGVYFIIMKGQITGRKWIGRVNVIK